MEYLKFKQVEKGEVTLFLPTSTDLFHEEYGQQLLYWTSSRLDKPVYAAITADALWQQVVREMLSSQKLTDRHVHLTDSRHLPTYTEQLLHNSWAWVAMKIVDSYYDRILAKLPIQATEVEGLIIEFGPEGTDVYLTIIPVVDGRVQTDYQLRWSYCPANILSIYLSIETIEKTIVKMIGGSRVAEPPILTEPIAHTHLLPRLRDQTHIQGDSMIATRNNRYYIGKAKLPHLLCEITLAELTDILIARHFTPYAGKIAQPYWIAHQLQTDWLTHDQPQSSLHGQLVELVGLRWRELTESDPELKELRFERDLFAKPGSDWESEKHLTVQLVGSAQTDHPEEKELILRCDPLTHRLINSEEIIQQLLY